MCLCKSKHPLQRVAELAVTTTDFSSIHSVIKLLLHIKCSSIKYIVVQTVVLQWLLRDHNSSRPCGLSVHHRLSQSRICQHTCTSCGSCGWLAYRTENPLIVTWHWHGWSAWVGHNVRLICSYIQLTTTGLFTDEAADLLQTTCTGWSTFIHFDLPMLLYLPTYFKLTWRWSLIFTIKRVLLFV